LPPAVDLCTEFRGSSGEKLGAMVDWQSVPAPRGGASSHAAALLQNENAFPEGAQPLRGSQSGDTGADDKNIACRP